MHSSRNSSSCFVLQHEILRLHLLQLGLAELTTGDPSQKTAPKQSTDAKVFALAHLSILQPVKRIDVGPRDQRPMCSSCDPLSLIINPAVSADSFKVDESSRPIQVFKRGWRLVRKGDLAWQPLSLPLPIREKSSGERLPLLLNKLVVFAVDQELLGDSRSDKTPREATFGNCFNLLASRIIQGLEWPSQIPPKLPTLQQLIATKNYCARLFSAPSVAEKANLHIEEPTGLSTTHDPLDPTRVNRVGPSDVSLCRVDLRLGCTRENPLVRIVRRTASSGAHPCRRHHQRQTCQKSSGTALEKQ